MNKKEYIAKLKDILIYHSDGYFGGRVFTRMFKRSISSIESSKNEQEF